MRRVSCRAFELFVEFKGAFLVAKLPLFMGVNFVMAKSAEVEKL